jgi:uncharacterized protein (TIGR04255 family)
VGRLDTHFLTRPELGEGLPAELVGLLTRLVVPIREIDATAIITQAAEPTTELHQPFLFDIDVFRQHPFDPDSPATWELLEQLRAVKNQIFFGSVTDKTLELFE